MERAPKEPNLCHRKTSYIARRDRDNVRVLRQNTGPLPTLTAGCMPLATENPGGDRSRSLDIGCGLAPRLPNTEVQVGLDTDFSLLRQSRQLYPRVYFVCGDGERLPFPDGVFDAVISRVALPRMNLNAAIPEISRVLKPGGRAMLNLHHFEFAWRDFLRRVRDGRPKAMIGGLWAIANGFIFHFFGRTLRLPFSHRFYDSFQTYSSMKRMLHEQGFADPIVEAYVIEAKKEEKPNDGFRICTGNTMTGIEATVPPDELLWTKPG